MLNEGTLESLIAGPWRGSHIAVFAIAVAHITRRSHKIAVRPARSDDDLSLLSAADRSFLSNSDLGRRPLDR